VSAAAAVDMPHLLMHLFSLMGTVLTKVIMRTPAPSWMVIADDDGSMALATTGTDSTAVHSQSLLTGLLWMLQKREGELSQAAYIQAERLSGQAVR